MKNDIRTAISPEDGSKVDFIYSSEPKSGAMKDVYFSPMKDYVVAFFRDPQSYKQRDRLERIVGKYRRDIFEQEGGKFWEQLFCWPQKIVESDGKLGIVVPTYGKDFFFQKDPARIGCEKEGKWFASAKLLRFVAQEERGNFLNYLKISLKLAQAVRRMHASGLAHSDLSYKNVLIDPSSGKACVIDCDGLVVPGKYPPDVIGTPDFIAPEVLTTQNLPDGQRTLPSQNTDKHALAVLIYMYLLHRHPLRGGRFFGPDVDNEELLLMGSQPLFIEHPSDRQNRNMKREYGKDNYDKYLPWIDLDNFPAEKICGPYLWKLFQKAFIDGLQNPMARPIANEWESALVKTSDIILQCSNKKCSQRFFVFDNSKHPRCPFCGTPYKDSLPVLDFYAPQGKGTYKPDSSRLLIWNGQSLCKWHVHKGVFPNERLKQEDQKRVGYFQFFNGQWIFMNENAGDMFEIMPDNSKSQILPGHHIKIEAGTRLLLSDSETGKVAVVQMANT
jgi:serine/threonine protein kinase